MQKKTIFSSGMLMAVSLVLLIILQGLWLRSEYRNSIESFGRETNMTLRSTLHQMADSIFINYTDTAAFLNDNHSQKNQSPTTFRRWIIAETNPYNVDSIARYYRRNLNPDYAGLQFTVLEKDFNFSYPRQPYSGIDSLPFTTAFHPFARKLYAAEFHDARALIISKIVPQAGFSLVTTSLIFLSFLLIFRNLRSQQKLMVQKDSFINNITHELKTPVASVSVALEAMKSFDVLQNKKKTMDYLEHASAELKRLEILTDKILSTSVLEYEGMYSLSRINLSELILKIIDSFKILTTQKQIEVDYRKKDTIYINGHEEELSQAIFNLLDNAVKYADSGGYIGVSISENPGYVQIIIEDKGPGISSEHKSRVFEKFYRIPTGNVHNVKGYGLGLYYVAAVIRRHHGKINLESQPQKGCKFLIKLPVNHALKTVD
jgi:signal transduction histidine kinase